MSVPYEQQIREGVQEAERATQQAHNVIARIHQYAVDALWNQGEAPERPSRHAGPDA